MVYIFTLTISSKKIISAQKVSYFNMGSIQGFISLTKFYITKKKGFTWQK